MSDSETEVIMGAFYLVFSVALGIAILAASTNARNTIRALCADMAEVGMHSGTCEQWDVRHRNMAQEAG